MFNFTLSILYCFLYSHIQMYLLIRYLFKIFIFCIYCLHTELSADILELWKQGAFIHRVLPPKRRREAEEEDLEAVRERERGTEEQEEGELREVRKFSKGKLLQVNVSS